MTKLTKKKKQLLELVNPENIYSLEEAMNIFQTVKSNKFDESVDIALRLGIDPGKSDQNVRGAITLPHSLGKTVSVAVFADGDQAKEANDAGADFVGMEDLAEKFKKEEIEVDVVISSQAAMKIVGQLGQVLGPKGLMPNPKTGTVTEKVGEAINNAKSGQVRFRTDKNGILHGCIGKVSFTSSQIQENAAAMLEEVKKLKPATAKGSYIRSVALSSTMGPGVKVTPASLVVV
ncbi:50S ribosomal protein L1 [Gammaproteobacteria bacterium]|jgi:large subunit ribosomal protein L1|nr:50S ribosomal protein L1 [Gammaproteobacteria bacterium]MDA8781341.1 50S ribosomal protein L1 [Gammaproteobacteria bacterium]MDB2339579.1 50S ribosomal protein L1 [Gammaproteobacteria bacterium]MDC0332687.1 50S ribosomal protein L1 [Gammaproteobacteria bacterium]MDC0918991.1 50S ribosomal protein L1 [Gammaproteobacteria bacterium]